MPALLYRLIKIVKGESLWTFSRISIVSTTGLGHCRMRCCRRGSEVGEVVCALARSLLCAVLVIMATGLWNGSEYLGETFLPNTVSCAEEKNF
jgi:hypothetical protein